MSISKTQGTHALKALRYVRRELVANLENTKEVAAGKRPIAGPLPKDKEKRKEALKYFKECQKEAKDYLIPLADEIKDLDNIIWLVADFMENGAQIANEIFKAE